jgi:hypothetical protein
MLKPNAKKELTRSELAALVAEYKNSGGVITHGETGVSQHLNKTRYVGRSALRGSRKRLGEA